MDSFQLELYVKPQAKRSAVVWDAEVERLIVQVKSSPTKGKANKEVVELLQDFFKTKEVKLVKGLTSTTKTVEITNPKANIEFSKEKT